MKIDNIINKIGKGVYAYKAADSDRKLVRQVDTNRRKLRNMCGMTQTRYVKCVTNSGHYSINPVGRFISFIKVWKSYFKE